MSSNVVRLSDKTKSQLDYLSDVTNISRKRLLGLIIGEIYTLGANFDRLSLDFESSVRENKIYIYLSGKSKLKFLTRTEIEGVENE